jgi:CBS domain-containing protein
MGNTPEQMAATIDAFHHIQRIRLEQQMSGRPGGLSNRVDPDDLHELDRLILKETFKQIQGLQRGLARAYAPV